MQITSQSLPTKVSVTIVPQATTSIVAAHDKETVTPFSMTFLGDIMLARSVELWMNEEGNEYPFKNIKAISSSTSAVIGNFEATIPSSHQPTASGAMRFSVSASVIPYLADSGITHVSLANNHAQDFGAAAYVNTKTILSENGITEFGQPNSVSSDSIEYITQASTTIGILAIHTLFIAPDDTRLQELIHDMSQRSDVQLAYIHWGEEYQLVHSPGQEKLATRLIELGIDVIVGHHPHVTQDIQLIHGVPVFYSLGNSIFDQYFSTNVQEGLTLRLTKKNEEYTFELNPITSIGSRSQPRLMDDQEKTVFLTNLAERSDPALTESIKTGKLIVTIPLATTTKNSTIPR